MEEMNVPRRRRKPRKKIPVWAVLLMIGLLLAVIIGVVVGIVMAGRNGDEPTPSTESPVVVVQVRLNGDEEVTLEYGSPFTDPGAVGQWWYEGNEQNPTDLDVTVNSNLDLTRLGTYTVAYTAECQGISDSQTRTVHVADTTAPEITLVTDPENYTLPGKDYQEEGYTAVDNHDGDITELVERRVEGNTVIYTVSDSSGNETQVIRQVRYDDPIAPELVLSGGKVVTITAGTKWNEPGYTATDNVDGEITQNVKITGSVNSDQPGTYYLEYQISDSSGNSASAKRTVVVRSLELGEPNGKVIYLTFDDGPGKYTTELLGILEKYGVKATFFVCKTGYLDLLDDIAADGHSIAIHSKSHKYAEIYASEDAFFEDITAMREIIKQYGGVDTTLLRFPGGSSNVISKKYCEGIMSKLTKAVEEQGYQYFDWNVDSKDAGGAKTADKVAQNVISGIEDSKRSSFIVLQHDIYKYSVDAVEQILIWGLENGYTFLPLDADSPGSHHPVNN